MARYSGPKGRVNRRLQSLIYETSGAAKALRKGATSLPGCTPVFRRPSYYGMALMKSKRSSIITASVRGQLRRYFGKATRQKGNTGENLLLLCEQRLDNVIRRVGLSKTRITGATRRCYTATSVLTESKWIAHPTCFDRVTSSRFVLARTF